jgi:glycosyltransferase involved in cell wall biosynthesis
MKIAIINGVEEPVPPKGYGGIEWIVYHLANDLGKRGHEVDLYASGDSEETANYHLIPIVEKSLRSVALTRDNNLAREAAKQLSIEKALEVMQKKQYDLIHNHAEYRFLTFAPLLSQPVLTTHHKPFNFAHQNLVYQQRIQYPFTSISNNQRKDFPQLHFIATVYNGINLDLFPYCEYKDITKHSYMAYLARMNDQKGAIEAATAAKQLQKKLVVGTKVDIVDQPYFDQFKSFIDDTFIEYLGEIGPDKRLSLLQNARLLIAPIKWEEPFGLMFIEAMVTGTPVVAFSRGAAPEIIVDGETGFLVNQSEEYIRGDWIVKKTGVEGLCEAIERLYAMSEDQYRQMRKKSRFHVEKNFTTDRMVDDYEKLYEKIISNRNF